MVNALLFSFKSCNVLWPGTVLRSNNSPSMKKALLLISFIFATITSFAQEKVFSMGLKGGFNHSWNSDDFPGDAPRNAFHAGAFFNLRLNDHWRLQPETYFSVQGEQDNKNVKNTSLGYNYLVFPIMVQYRFKKRFFIEAGPQIGALLNRKPMPFHTLDYIPYRDNNVNIFDVMIAGGAGYQVNRRVSVYARANHGVTNIRALSLAKKDYNVVLQLGVNYSLF